MNAENNENLADMGMKKRKRDIIARAPALRAKIRPLDQKGI